LTADEDPVELAARALQHRDRSRRDVDERLARAGIDEERRNDALDTL
jgi:SOS response regulatory protein OraA/RecX